MTRLFLDTSSLVKLFVREAGTDELVAMAETADEVAVSALAEFEFLSAIGRRRSDGELTAMQYEEIRTVFYGLWAEGFVQQPLSEEVLGRARVLLASYRLRTLDAFQLASAITYALPYEERPRFLTADRELGKVAQREGFSVS